MSHSVGTMSRILILGCPRSGTSMLTGLFANQGIYIGGRAHQPTISNPKGYFETRGINELNNRIISKYLEWPMMNRLRHYVSQNFNVDVRAFAFASPLKHEVKVLPAYLSNAMKYYASKGSFCYKDPRFCVTLPAWAEYLGKNTKYLVVFREPEKIIASYIKNGIDIYDPPLLFNGKELELAFVRNYRRLIEWSNEEWMFMHYDQILSGAVSEQLEDFSSMKLDWGHIETKLKRTKSADYVCSVDGVANVYKELCRLADYT